jgi:hypothetical protein
LNAIASPRGCPSPNASAPGRSCPSPPSALKAMRALQNTTPGTSRTGGIRRATCGVSARGNKSGTGGTA